MVDLKGQYDKIKDEVNSAIQDVIDQSSFIKGKYVKNFTENLAQYLGVKHVIPTGNGTDSLQLAMMALGYKRGDEVITTPFTFVATVEVMVLLGLRPVFVDVDPHSFNIDPEKIEAAITPKTRGIVPVHLFGQSCDMTAILAIAKKHSLDVIEDAAQAISATCEIDGKTHKCGTIGDIGSFSFFPSKNLGAYGDGGALCTNNPDLAKKMELYANHGSSKKYYYESVGINSRLDGLQAAILDIKLKYLDGYVKSRVGAADVYDKLLHDTTSITTPKRLANRNHVFHQYTLQIDSNGNGDRRNAIQKKLSEKGIPSAIYYPEPLHYQSVYSFGVYKKGDFPVAESMSNNVLSLPMHTELTVNMQEHIVENLNIVLHTT